MSTLISVAVSRVAVNRGARGAEVGGVLCHMQCLKPCQKCRIYIIITILVVL